MTALHILHITRADSLPTWFTEAEAQLKQIAADNGCEAVVLDTTPSVEIAPWDVIPDVCQHDKGKSAVGRKLECHECGAQFTPRTYAEVGQVTLYGNGQSLRGFTRADLMDQRELNTYHDGVRRR